MDDKKTDNINIIIGFILFSFIILLIIILLINYSHIKDGFKSAYEQASDLMKQSKHIGNFDKFRANGGDAVSYTILNKCNKKNQLNESCLVSEIQK